MDDTLQIILVALAPIIFGPFFVWLFRKFKRKKKPKHIAQCPQCKSLIGLPRFQNYICGSCGAGVGFYHLETKEPFPEIEIYNCENCEAENFDGFITCIQCGHYHEERIRS
ncbi:MAG: hypothetical protein GY816_18350 [Cytophagales bacterium]|nr:hypothetical protein [Cytophagales bacterium]